jgi:LacI family transcriptional regulator
MAGKRPTMRDIARELGTSAVTVSKALAGKPGMSDDLRRAIQKKASAMGYEYPHGSRPAIAEHLEIGILIPDQYFSPDSFYAEMYKRLVKRLADLGHFGLLEILDPDSEKGLLLPNLLTAKHVDGLILLGEPAKAYYRKIAQAGIPVVFLDFYDEQANADAVAGDNSYGTYRLTSHLIRRGHRRIGFVGNSKASGSIMDRFLGFTRAMLMNDLEIRPEWILSDREQRGQLVKPDLPEELPTAFVCNCDITARMLISQLQDRGLRVPEDISVTGFDDYPQGSENDVPLSTFRMDTDGMIELAVKTLLERCAGEQRPFGRLVVGGQPVYRDSEIPYEEKE